MSELRTRLINLAKREARAGAREHGGANKGAAIQKYFDADGYDPNGKKPGDDGYAWCASFICYLFQEAMRGGNYTFARPTTPGAFAFSAWSLSQDNSVKTYSKPIPRVLAGDLCIWDYSHISIAVTDADEDGYFQSVEGNTNDAGSREGDGVYQKLRHMGRLRNTIRVMV